MTMNEQPDPLDPRAMMTRQLDDARALAALMLDVDDFPYLDTLPHLIKHLPAVMFVHLCRTLEACPIHMIDATICRDDADCTYVR